MKGALIAMGAMLFAMLFAVYWLHGSLGLGTAIKTAGVTGGKFLPILFLAFLMMGCVELLLPADLTERWLSDAAGWRGIIIAWIAGALTPAGSVVGLPLIAALSKAGAGLSVLITYMVSLALLSAIRFPMEVGIVGWRLAILRFTVCLFVPPLTGIITLTIVRIFDLNITPA